MTRAVENQIPLFELSPAGVVAVPEPSVIDSGRDDALYDLAERRANVTGESIGVAYAYAENGSWDPYDQAEDDSVADTSFASLEQLAEEEGPVLGGDYVFVADREHHIRETVIALLALGKASRNTALSYSYVQEEMARRGGLNAGSIAAAGMAKVTTYLADAGRAVARSYGSNELSGGQRDRMIADFMNMYAGPANAAVRTQFRTRLRRIAARYGIDLTEPR